MAVIFYFSSLQDPPIPSGSDKPLHGVGYTGLAVVVVRALAGGMFRPITVRTGIIALLITTGYACTDEVHQMFVPGRSADIPDLLADAAGAAVGTVGSFAWGIISHSSRNDL
jgi:VanZ family protein